MSTKNKVLAFLLAAVISAGGLPAAVHASDENEAADYIIPIYDVYDNTYNTIDAPQLFSMMPLEEQNIRLSLNGYLPSELEAFPFSKLIELLKQEYPYYDFGTIQSIADRDEGAGDDFQIADDDFTLNLSSESYYNTWSSHYHYFEMITGDNADQLNMSNTRYILTIYVNSSRDDLLNISGAADSNREALDITGSYLGTIRRSYNGKYIYENYLDADIYTKNWPEDNQAYISLNLGQYYADSLETEIYTGYYETEEEIPEDAENITGQILDQEDLTENGGYCLNLNENTELTAVFKRDGGTAAVFPFRLEFYRSSMGISNNPYLYADTNNGYRKDVWRGSSSKTVNGVRTYTITLASGYDVDGTYYYGNVVMNHPTQSSIEGYGIEFVKKAVVGNYKTADEILSDTLPDIKELLFCSAYSEGGYAADYSEGVTFSVLDIEDNIHRFCIKTEAYPEPEEGELPSAPRPLSADTYFRAESAYLTEEGSREYLSSYVMPYDADAYYYNGYQTVFLMAEDEDNNAVPVPEGSAIAPVFHTGNKVHMYATHDATSGSIQTSGETETEFHSGEVTQYSAAAENGTHLKNYWVTYLTQQTDETAPKLFINGANDKERYVTVDDEELYQRELFLIDDFDNYHDIFFANLGDKELDGMYIRLEDAVNVELDEYWTIADGSSLGAFTTTEERDANGHYVSYGELQNVGKVRLRANLDEDGNAIYGMVSGTLVIGYTGSSSDDGVATVSEGAGEEYRILLSGIAANPKVMTAELADAVKYVPYSQLIMTNNMYDNDKVKFEIVDGSLPDGIELRPNGEIYGLPTEIGEFSFKAEITFTSEVYGITITDTREYTINVLDNTDTNVFWTNETDNQGYVFVEENELGMVGTQNPDHEILYHVWIDEDSYVTVDINSEAVIDEYELELFWSTGPHDAEFMYFFLDAEELIPGVDYTSEEGSTKINIQSQTFRNAGEGHHTIAAEFRTGKTDDGLMKRTSQNVYVHNITSTGEPSNPSRPNSSYFQDILEDMQNYVKSELEDIKEEEQKEEQPIESDSVESSAQHSITFVQSPGGTVTSSYVQATEGTLVTLTVSVFSGFRMKTIEAKSEISVYLTRISDEEYTFTMPNCPVEIRTAFEDTAPVPTELPFRDVPQSAWYFSSIAYVSSRGLMNGTDSTSFTPDIPTSRAMLVTVFYRLAGKPEISTETSFADVTEGSYYADAVAWAAETGIVEGYSKTLFGTDDPVTREQVAAILYRYAERTGRNTDAANPLINYADADQISAYAVPAMEWANAEGLILGTTEVTLDPTGTATRAQIAAILARFQRGE